MRATKEQWMRESIKFLLVSSLLILVSSIIIIIILKFYYLCMISQYYIVNLIGFILFIASFITICIIKLKQIEDNRYYNSQQGRIELLNKKYYGSSFCPSFFDLTDDEYDYQGWSYEKVHPLLTVNLSRVEETAYKNAFVIRGAGTPCLPREQGASSLNNNKTISFRHQYHQHTFHPLPNNKNKKKSALGQDILFPSKKAILLDCGHIACHECMVGKIHGYERDNCRSNFYHKQFNYDHSKYMKMQKWCVDGYIRQSENEINGLNVPMVINDVINEYMPQKEKWECYYEYGQYFDPNDDEWKYAMKQNQWE